jgi:hypothetical protein
VIGAPGGAAYRLVPPVALLVASKSLNVTGLVKAPTSLTSPSPISPKESWVGR